MDLATAESAKRNLNGREYNGRNLRVDFADAADREAFAKKAGGAGGGGGAPISYDTPIGGPHAAAGGAQMSAAGMGQGGGMDQITNRISEMSPAQLFSVMNQLKQLIGQDQTGARQLLVQNPQLTLAIFQAQLTLGMTKAPSGGLQGAVQKGGQGIPGDGAPPPGLNPPGPPRPMGGYPGNPAAPYGAPPPPPPGVTQGYGMGGGVMRPGPPPGPPAVGGVAPLPPPQMSQMGGMDQQQALLQQVMSMTPEQMAMLPPDQRQQVEMLRQLASQQMM